MDERKALDTGSVPIIGNFNLTQQMPNGRTMQVAGYLYEGEGTESINARVDMVQEVMERQRLRLEVPELEIKLEQMESALVQYLEAYNDLLARSQGKGSKGVASAEKSHLQTYPVNIKKLQADIEKGKRAIATARAAGGLAA